MEWNKEYYKDYNEEKIKMEIKIMSIKDLFDIYQNGLIDFDFELYEGTKLQREKVWKIKNFECLFKSLKSNLPIGEIVFVKKEDTPKIMVSDGKQRLLSIFEFMEGKFKISRNFNDIKFFNRFWDDLPNEVQKDILEYKIPISIIHTNNEEKQKEIAGMSFTQINTCVKITGFEKIRNMFKRDNRKLEKISEHPIFNLLSVSKSRYQHQRICFQCLMLDSYASSNKKEIKENIDSKSMEKFAGSYKNGIPDIEIERVKLKFDYLYEVFNNIDCKKKCINGTNFINLYILADRVMDYINTDEFSLWVLSFFFENKENDNEYWTNVKIQSTVSGSAINKKVQLLKKDLLKFLKK